MLFPPTPGTKHISITIWKASICILLKLIAQQNGYTPCTQLLSSQGLHVRFTKANLQGHKREIKTYKETMSAERDSYNQIRLRQWAHLLRERFFIGHSDLCERQKWTNQASSECKGLKDTQTFQAIIWSKDLERVEWISHAYTCAITNIGHQARDPLVFTSTQQLTYRGRICLFISLRSRAFKKHVIVKTLRQLRKMKLLV